MKTEPRTEAGRNMLMWLGSTQRPGTYPIRDAILAIEAEAIQGAAPRAEGLDALASILRKLIRQYHGVAHGGGSWLFCDDRWCADMREVLGEER